MKIKGAKQITKKIAKEIGNYNFEVGILQNAPKKLPKKGQQKVSQVCKLRAWADRRREFPWLKLPNIPTIVLVG